MQAKKMEDTIHGLDMKMKEKDLKNKNLQDKVIKMKLQMFLLQNYVISCLRERT